MNNKVNHNINLLYKFNLSDENSLKIFNHSTRDINNLKVLKCINSGVIVLEKFIISEDYYEKNIQYTIDNIYFFFVVFPRKNYWYSFIKS